MGIRDILVHLDNSAASAARIDSSIAYAKKHNARLRGLYLMTHDYYTPSSIGEKADHNKIEQLFSYKTAKAGITAEWLFHDSFIVGSNISDLLTTHAYFLPTLLSLDRQICLHQLLMSRQTL